MRRYTFNIIFKQLLAKKKIVIGFIVIMLIACGTHGFMKAKGIGRALDEIQADEEYAEQLKNYEDSIVEVDGAVANAEEAVEKQQDYVDKSIYMKLDSQKIYVADIQYALDPGTITNAEGESVTANTNIGNVQQAYVLYVNDGAFRKAAIEYFNQNNTQQYDYEIAEEYLKELVAVSLAGNAVNVLIQCPDENFANQMLQATKQALDTQKSTIEEVHGVYNVQELSATVYTKTDAGVLNAQNGNINNLKNYKNALADCLSKQNGVRESKNNYIEKKDIETSASRNPVKEILKWIIYGLILGICIPFAIMFLAYVISDKIKSEDEIMAAGLEAAKADDIQAIVQRLYLLSKKKKADRVYLWSLSESDKLSSLKDDIEKELSEALGEKFRIELITGLSPKLQDMSEMIECGNVMLAVSIGKDTYIQLEQTLEQLSALETDCWGCVVL